MMGSGSRQPHTTAAAAAAARRRSPPSPLLLLLLALVLLLLPAHASAAALVEHSLDAGRTWAHAGWVHLDDVSPDGGAVSASLEREPWGEPQLRQLRGLVQQDRLYLWRVRLPGEPPAQTSIRAACVAQRLAEQPRAALSLDVTGRIVAAALRAPGAHDEQQQPCSAGDALRALDGPPPPRADWERALPVLVQLPPVAPRVPRFPAGDAAAAGGDPLASAAGQQQQQQQQKQQQQSQQQQQGGDGAGADGGGSTGGGAAGGKKQPPVDNRSWLQKNWLFIAAGGSMLLNLVMKNAVGDLPQQAAAGGGGGAARPGGQRGRAPRS